MKHRRILGVLLVAGIGMLIASGCSSSMNDAATVKSPDAQGDHTVHISPDELQRQVTALVDNKALASALSQNFSLGEPGTSTDAKLTATWLTQMIRQAVVTTEFDSQHLQVSPEVRTNAAALLASKDRYGPDVFNSFPKWLQDNLINGEAQIETLLRSCASGRLVSHILVKTQAEAEAAAAKLKAGVPFAQVAQTSSIDTGSKNAGGVVGCLAPGEFVPAFQQAAEKAEFGVVTQPVKTKFGYHLILASKWDPRLAANPQIGQLLQQAASAALDARLTGAKVWVDPRYGTWGEQDSQNGKVKTVIPPVVPPVRDQRESK